MTTSRERLLTALSNGRPDRLPCQVHGWMDYYLKTYLNGMDAWQAYEKFGMDFVIYVSPGYTYNKEDRAKWEVKRTDLGPDDNGNNHWAQTIVTPRGELHQKGAWNAFTEWTTEVPIKTPADFELWDAYCPVPTGIDFSRMIAAKERLGDRGIIRSNTFRGGIWQTFCGLLDTEKAILLALDEPDFVHHALAAIQARCLKVTEMWQGIPADIIEFGGGAASSTVISPALFREFCLPYDKTAIQAIHGAGPKVVYHLCGGLMPMLDLVAETGADGLETMTPPAMGGDCDLREASRRIGDKLFFIGGFDQNAGFERGTPAMARKLVHECFEATRDHAGYIVSPSDHFFHGAPSCLQAFADAAKECAY